MLQLFFLQILSVTSTTRFNVSEEQSPGTFVGQLHNVDPGGTYCFTTMCGWSPLFKLDIKIGTITTTRVIDRESLPMSLINLVLEGTDSQARKTIQWFDVFIEDINDNPPTFLNTTETLSVPENLGKTSFNLGPWSDADSGINSMLSAAYVSIGDSSLFSAVIESSGDYQQVVLHIAHSLDREVKDLYNVTIEIRDNGFLPLTGHLTVLINVQDVNDNQPVFPQSIYKINVKESVSVGTQLLQFNATDADSGDNGKIVYYLSGVTSNFAVSQDNGVLSIRRKLDYEKCYSYISQNVKGYKFKVNARDLGLSSYERSALVEITLIDVNDNDPIISFFSPTIQNNNELDLVENTPRETYIATIMVSDLDSGDNGDYDVFIESGGEGKFKIKKDTSRVVILIADNIDREVKDMYNIKITAIDKGTPPRNSSNNLIINILDVNDNTPRFSSSSLQVSINEDVLINTLIVAVNAVDPDLKSNGTVRYALVTPHNSFKLSSTGQLTTTQLLDYEKHKYHIFNISASDNGVPSLTSYQTLNLSIVDVNDNIPIFSQSVYSCNVKETAVDLNCAVSAMDADSGDNGRIVYSVNSDMFSIDQNTGKMSLIKSLDYESLPSHSVIVQASDYGGRSTIAEVVINVLDVNDERPIFERLVYSASLPEGVLMSTIVRVKAMDADDGDSVSYCLNPGSMFTINKDGMLSNSRTLSEGFMTVVVCAIDSAGNAAPHNATVNITILKKTPDLPIFTTGVFDCSIREDAGTGTVATTVTASTQTTCNIIYSISDSSHFTIDPSSGIIATNNVPLDYEQVTSYSLDVTASCGIKKGLSKVAVAVIDSNDNSPQCQDTDKIFVSEDLAPGSIIYSWVCNDADTGLNSALSYKVIEGTVLFEMGSQGGAVVLKNVLDREASSSHLLKIEVCDSGAPVLCSQYSLKVYLTDVNDNTPQFTGPLTFTVLESAKENYMIGKIIAEDADTGSNSQITYSLLSPNANITLFGSGELIVQNSLDYEIIPRYFLQVSASDHGLVPRSNTTLITIIILDVNDNTPVFDRTNLTFSVMENTATPVLLGTVHATDADTGPNKIITYSLISDQFSVNSTTGEISITTLLDYEHSARYEVSVRATDNGSPSLSAATTVIINVKDVNDNAPIFEQDVYYKMIREDIDVGSEVTRVRAIDADTDMYNKVTYSLISKYFTISQEGVISTTVELDRELLASHNITVLARDNDNLSTKCNVIISIQDVNDNAPLFESNNIIMDIIESTALGTVITTIVAQDADKGLNSQISYSMINSEYFLLDKNTGDLVLLKKLQYTLHTTLTLSITATDHGTPSLSSSQTLSITVIDVNDNQPYFTDNLTSVEVTENSKIGMVIFQVSAKDSDSGSAGQVKYNITSPFSIGSDTGVVTVADVIDRESTTSISITVCATDQAYPIYERLGTCKSVVVIVLDENDNKPVFTDNKVIKVMEDVSVGTVVSVINATDYDINKTLQYTITSQHPPNTVIVQQDTGIVSLARVLDYEMNSVACDFTVMIKDEGGLENSLQMTVMVVDVNDNVPIFTNPPNQRVRNIPPTISINEIIYTVEASDADSRRYGHITFSLPSSYYFSINPNTGEVTIAKSVKEITFEVITVRATDGGGLSSTIQISVHIQAQNTAPYCTERAAHSVSEATAINTLIFSVTCYDLDWGSQGKLDLSLINGNSAHNFEILDNGDVILVSSLDYETQQKYNIVVLAQDRGKPSLKSISTIILTIQNENDNAPFFAQSEGVARVFEDTSINTVLYSARCTDLDLSTLLYSLSNTSVFNITGTGDIVLVSQLDRETMDLYQVTVKCTDGKFSASLLLHIIVVDVDDISPVFYSSPLFKVISSQGIVGGVGATDDDDATLSYSFISSKRSTQYSIDSEYGIIRCVSGNCNSEDLTVVAAGRIKSSQKSVKIITGGSRGGGGGAVFEKTFYSINVSESVSVGTTLLKVATTSSENLVIEGGNYGTSFGLRNTSELYVRNSLDYEMWRVYNLTLSVVYQGYNYYTIVQVNILNVNDNNPVFLPSYLSVYLMDNVISGTEVCTVKATGAENDVLYDMEYTEHSHFYNIDKVHGVITTKDSLVNQDTKHHLVVKGYSPQPSNPLYITVHISKVEKIGMFEKEDYEFNTYISSVIYSVVGKVAVNSLKYRYTFQPASSLLHIYPDSGIIVIKERLKGSILQEIVIATNTFNTSLTTSTSLTVNILPSICSPNPCYNGGQCVDYADQYHCNCEAYTLGTNCECSDVECHNEGTCQYINNSKNIEPEVQCLCSDGSYKELCTNNNTLIMIILISVGVTLVLILTVIVIVCQIRSRRRKDEFDKAVLRDRDKAYTDNIILNPVNVTHLALDNVPEYKSYSHHDQVQENLSRDDPYNFRTDMSYRSSSSECTEAVIFSKLKQLDYGSEEGRYDKDSGLAGSLNSLCHFDDEELESYNKNYLTDWGPKVQNLVNVLDIVTDEGAPVKEEFV